uniref:CLV3/ESR-related protein n=1 Tax=Adiantum aethiopicum TaxID=450919 RepID=A0A0U2SG56_9MONI|nr:CLV3/ESR-related protein [Adiantum aethiopicum]
MQIKLQRLRHGIALLVLYCLLLAPVFATTRQSTGGWHGVAVAPQPSAGISESVTISDHHRVQKTNSLNWHHTSRTDQAQLVRRQKEVLKRGKRKRAKTKLLHEVPSGPNPISNEIPTKLVDAQKLPTSMP